MIVGFTGTSKGLTRKQFAITIDFIRSLKPKEFHHGDCIGADAQLATELFEDGDLDIHVHPPISSKARAFSEADYTYPKKGYLQRNHDIVDVCDVLVATPWTVAEILRSGTWATIRYARKRGKSVVIVFPDGRIEDERK